MLTINAHRVQKQPDNYVELNWRKAKLGNTSREIIIRSQKPTPNKTFCHIIRNYISKPIVKGITGTAENYLRNSWAQRG